MALYIRIVRLGGDAGCSLYRFETLDGDGGEISLDHAEGQVELRVPHPGDEERRFYERAARKLKTHRKNLSLRTPPYSMRQR